MSKPLRAAGSRLLVALAVAAGTTLAATGTAQAEPTLFTGTSVTDDYAVAEIYSIGFTRHTVAAMGAIWDRCGTDGIGDGAGAYIRARVKFGNGTWAAWSEWKGDGNGCHNGGFTWSHHFDHPNRVVTDLQLQLCERDDGTSIECVSPTYDNPKVAG